jgi:hypothetical protein
VALVPKHADQLGGQCFVENGNDTIAIGPVGLGDRTPVDVGAGVFPEGLDIGKMITHSAETYPLQGVS